jgi:hypothetical protein
VLHEGDITDGDSPSEWANAKASLSLLDGVIPYALAVGNHDGLMTAQSQTANFNQAFPLSRLYAVEKRPLFGMCLWLYEKAHQTHRRIGSPNSDRIH